MANVQLSRKAINAISKLYSRLPLSNERSTFPVDPSLAHTTADSLHVMYNGGCNSKECHTFGNGATMSSGREE